MAPSFSPVLTPEHRLWVPFNANPTIFSGLSWRLTGFMISLWAGLHGSMAGHMGRVENTNPRGAWKRIVRGPKYEPMRTLDKMTRWAPVVC